MTYEELTYQILSTELIDRPEKLRKVSKMLAAIMEGIKQPATCIYCENMNNNKD